MSTESHAPMLHAQQPLATIKALYLSVVSSGVVADLRKADLSDELPARAMLGSY
jgi:hypothetical protein